VRQLGRRNCLEVESDPSAVCPRAPLPDHVPVCSLPLTLPRVDAALVEEAEDSESPRRGMVELIVGVVDAPRLEMERQRAELREVGAAASMMICLACLRGCPDWKQPT
jgi:hypothetical protein